MDQLSVDMASSAMLRGVAHAVELNTLGAGIRKMALTTSASPPRPQTRLHVATNQISELADPGDREFTASYLASARKGARFSLALMGMFWAVWTRGAEFYPWNSFRMFADLTALSR